LPTLGSIGRSFSDRLCAPLALHPLSRFAFVPLAACRRELFVVRASARFCGAKAPTTNSRSALRQPASIAQTGLLVLYRKLCLRLCSRQPHQKETRCHKKARCGYESPGMRARVQVWHSGKEPVAIEAVDPFDHGTPQHRTPSRHGHTHTSGLSVLQPIGPRHQKTTAPDRHLATRRRWQRYRR